MNELLEAGPLAQPAAPEPHENNVKSHAVAARPQLASWFERS
jgi:hypothetical protein